MSLISICRLESSDSTWNLCNLHMCVKCKYYCLQLVTNSLPPASNGNKMRQSKVYYCQQIANERFCGNQAAGHQPPTINPSVTAAPPLINNINLAPWLLLQQWSLHVNRYLYFHLRFFRGQIYSSARNEAAKLPHYGQSQATNATTAWSFLF